MTARGVAFTAPEDGDMRADIVGRRRLSHRLGISAEWAVADQEHGTEAVFVDGPGPAGAADGMVTTRAGLPLAVFTADCLGVVLQASRGVGVAHAGWRGLAAGVLESTMQLMESSAASPTRAHIGPSIGPCCFEVGREVARLFPRDVSVTTWGSTSVDLVGAALRRLEPLEVVVTGRCTACGGGLSHRRDRTARRMAAIGWLP